MSKTNIIGILLALLSACGGGGGSIPFDQLDERMAKSACAKLFSCCDEAERTTFLMQLGNPAPTTQAECESRVQSVLAAGLSLQKAAIDSGKIVYHDDAASDCADAFDDSSCAAFGADPLGGLSCDDVISGTVAAGAACNSNDECSGASFCQGRGTTTPGMCKALPASGEACPDNQCQKGYYCKGDPVTAKCTAVEANGQACKANGDCQSGHCEGSPGSGMCADKPAMCSGA